MDNDKNITLKDLQQPQEATQVVISNLKEVTASEIRPTSSKEDPMEKEMNALFNKTDAAIERKKEEIDVRREKIIEELEDKREESSIPSVTLSDTDSDDEDDDSTIDTDKSFMQPNRSIFADETDFDEDEDEDDTANEKQMKDVKSAIKNKLKPVANVIDISTFSISKKPVSVLNSLKGIASNKKTVDWVLPATGMSIQMEAYSGLEIQKLDPKSSSKNRLGTYSEIYSILYNHVTNVNKPKTMEEWVKLVNFFDINHIYFTAYKASFDGANSLPYNCQQCNEIFMEDTEIDSMVKYKDDETKEKIKQLFQKTTDKTEYNVEMVQISDEYVIGLREPSIYNVIFENVILDEKFTEKYSDLLSLLAYVDSVYYINREDNSLQPIELNNYPNNPSKTIKSKVRKYSQILEELTSDQFYAFNSFIKAINDRHDEVTYIIPEVNCPKCNAKIPEQEMNAETLLFTRHQLAGIANI